MFIICCPGDSRCSLDAPRVGYFEAQRNLMQRSNDPLHVKSCFTYAGFNGHRPGLFQLAFVVLAGWQAD
jgi:hypothetical protein